MPHHKQVTTCRKSCGPVSKFCTCEHCTLSVCEVCGAFEGSLTTDCPGEQVDLDRQKEVYETNLDYTKTRGWHQGESMKLRSPRFEPRKIDEHQSLEQTAKRLDDLEHDPFTKAWTSMQSLERARQRARHRTSTRVDLSSIQWERHHEQTKDLQHELAQRAVAWVIADRICDDRAAALLRIENEVDAHLQEGRPSNEHDRELIGKLANEGISFRLADQRAQKCDEEFRQAAQKLVDALEQSTIAKGTDP